MKVHNSPEALARCIQAIQHFNEACGTLTSVLASKTATVGEVWQDPKFGALESVVGNANSTVNRISAKTAENIPILQQMQTALQDYLSITFPNID